MKKFIALLVLLIAPMFVLLAQEEIPIPDDISDLVVNYPVFFATYLGLAGVAMFLGEFVIRILKISVKWQKVVVTFLLALIAAVVSNFGNFGFLAEATWIETGLWGLLAGVLANGFFSGNFLWLKTLVEWLIGFLVKKEPVE